MSQQIVVEPDDLLLTVISRWEDLTGAQIGQLAEQLAELTLSDGLRESKLRQLEADTNILVSLQHLKQLRAESSLPELIDLWRKVNEGENKAFGGMIHGEDSRHFRKALRFVEGAILAQALPLVEEQFARLTEKCCTGATAEIRRSAYETAANTLRKQFSELDLIHDKLEGLLDRMEARLDELEELEIERRMIDRSPPRTGSAKRPARKGRCEVCGKERALRRIDSGHSICSGCYAEMRPPRPKHLVTYATLEAFHRKGIDLPETTTRMEAKKLRENLDTLHYLLMDSWYVIRRASFDSCGRSRDDLERACYALLNRDDLGQRLLGLEQKRMEVGHQGYKRILDDVRVGKPSAKNDYYLEDGALCSRNTGREIAYWDFKPPLIRNEDFDKLHDLLHQHFPALIPKGKETGTHLG